MKRKFGLVFMGLGTVLLGMALSLFLYNNHQALEARQSAEGLLPQIMQQIEASAANPTEGNRPEVLPGTPLELLDAEDCAMTETEINGYSYIGYLSIPELELELPILSDWSYGKLKIAPCRYSGTILSEDLVLMAHNYPSHFGNLQSLTVGAMVSFTDMNGRITRYEVAAMEVLGPTAVEDMTAGEFDLTLFTCTLGGKSRVTVRCDRILGE